MTQTKRRFMAFALILLLAFSFVACVGKTGDADTIVTPATTESNNTKPLDLTGCWDQSNKKSETSYQSASISGTVIEVYWIDTESSSKALYWAGTYTAPTETKEEYTWDSQNDKSKTDNALLASGDDTKTFTYSKGVISYTVTALGMTTTVELSKTSDIPGEMMEGKEDTASTSMREMQPLELVESGWAVIKSIDEYYVQYAIVVKNPNTDLAVEFPTVRLTAKDANGGILGTEDIVGHSILPGETWAYAFQGPSCDAEPAAVEFDLTQPDDSEWVSPSRLDFSGEPLIILNPKKGSDKITGEISNTNDYDISSAAVTVIFRDADGKISYGETTFVDDVLAGKTTPFELSIWGAEEFMTDTFEVYAYPKY